MDPTHRIVNEELDRLEETLSWTTQVDQRAAFSVGCRFLAGLALDAEISALASNRVSEIKSKYGLI